MSENTARKIELEDALDEALAADLAGEARPDGYLITTKEDAAWASLKRRQYQARIDEVRRIAATRRALIDEWEADAVKADEASVEHFDGLLTFYHQTVIRDEVAEGVKDARLSKSIKLPAVTLTSRAGAQAWEVDDDEFHPWAARHRPDLIETTTRTKLAEVKKAFVVGPDGKVIAADAPDLEAVPGITVTSKPRTFAVKPT